VSSRAVPPRARAEASAAARAPAGEGTRGSLLLRTHELVAGLGELLGLDVLPGGPERARLLTPRVGSPAVPPHLSFSDVPGALRRAGRLLERMARGDARAGRALAEWMTDTRALEVSLDGLHAAGAIPVAVREACQALLVRHRATVRDWAAWASPGKGGRRP
jgi:hypothetical protein